MLLPKSFGFDPQESTHHFLVDIGATQVTISEHFTWESDTGSGPVAAGDAQDGQVRVILPRPAWNAIAQELRAQFNRRLKQAGEKCGAWHTGHNLVRRELGKELVLLVWGIEEADPALIPAALANWSGLVPEERWWLYTQTAAATGHGIHGRGRGWRVAVRYALTDNPVAVRTSLG